MNILVGEDEKDIALAYKYAFENKNHTVNIAYTGKECIEFYEQHPEVDIVLLDYKMPELNGIEAAEKIIKLNPDQKIVFISAFVKDSLWKKMMAFGKNIKVLQKPVSLNLLFDIIEQ